MPELRPYQVEAVKDILEKKRVLIADDMSMGKCAEAIAAKIALDMQGNRGSALIVCPSSVSQHWEDEIRLWYPKGRETRIARINSTTYDSDVRSAQGADFVIVGYPTLSYLGAQKSKIGALRHLGFNYGILDEAHNAKNPDSIRSTAVKSLFDSMEYLAILSGTPIPNSVVDIYMLLSLLDKDQFPVNAENSKVMLNAFYTMFRRDPEFVRRVLNDRMLRRTVDDYLHAKFPRLERNDLEVTLDGEHREAYIQVYQNDDIKAASKLLELRRAALDPNLVNPAFLNGQLTGRNGRMDSTVYQALDGLVQSVADNRGKVLLFSDLREGVTEKLRQRYGKYGAVVIDGDNNDLGYREDLRRRFQTNPDCKVLIATTVMDEGVDLTAATDVVHLTLPYAPATFDQRNRRPQRIGEVEKDHVTVHVVKSRLSELTPTITEGIERLLDDKRRIVTFIMEHPFKLTEGDLSEIKNGHSERSKHLTPLIGNPVGRVFSHFAQLKGQGSDKIRTHYQKYPEEAKTIAELYADHWEGFYGGNTATLYARLVKSLEARKPLEKMLDIASGPFSLSRRLGRPVTNLDLNPHMHEAGRIMERAGTIVPGNIAVEGSYHNMPFDKGSFDFALLSLALHMSKLKGKGDANEREQALREMNRVLKTGGFGVITLPHGAISETDFPSFHEGLEKTGFEVFPFSGFYKGAKGSTFKVYMAGLRKVAEPGTAQLPADLFEWVMDRELARKRGSSTKSRKHVMKDPKIIEPEFVDEFRNARTGKTLEESIQAIF